MEAILAYLVVVGAIIIYVIKKFIDWRNNLYKGKKKK